MRKGLILLLIMILILFNVDTRALRAKKIDLRLMEQEKAVVFLRLSGSISLLINDGDNSNLFILEYKNDNNLNQALQVFDSNPDIYYLKNMTEKRIDDIYVLKDKNEDNEKFYVSLDSDDEIDYAFSLFFQKYNE